MSNTFAIKEVMDYTVSRYSSTGVGDALFTVDYASSSTINTTSERLPIRGGQGNFKILDLDHTKDCTFESMLPIVDTKALAAKLGVDVTEGATTAPKKEVKTADASNKITLASTPASGTLKVYLVTNERDISTEQTAGTPASVVNEYSISGTEITLNATTAPEGTKFMVLYDYTTGSSAQNIKITATDFPNFITITGTGLVDDDQAGQKIPVTFKIHKAKVKPEFALTMASTAATELDFTCDCYTVINSAGDREYIDIVKLNDEAF